MKCALAFFVAGLSCLLGGCGGAPAVSLRPLYAAGEKPVAEPRLEGEWTVFSLGSSGVSQQAQWKVAAQTDGCYAAERQKKDAEKKPEQDESETYRTCLVALDNKLFFDAELAQKRVGSQMIRAKDMSPGMVGVHVVGRVWPQPDFVRLAQLGPAWTKRNVPEELRDSSAGPLVFTGSTLQLRDLMAKHADDPAAMTSAWYLCRAGVECGQRIVEDELARAPDEPSVLHDAAQFYSDQGNYAKALALLQKRAALEPADASNRLEVGLQRLFLRDFPGARDDFAAAANLNPTIEPDGWVPVSYFLEGKYAAAHQALLRLESLPDSGSALLIVLDYASLHRMGRDKQAEAFLSERMAHLVAAEDEQLFLLRATGRIKDYSPDFHDDDLEFGIGDLYALVRLAKGDRESARKALQETVSKVSKGNLAYLGAQIELERLDANTSKAKR
jgi:tetratricopeptide (TPR) repeat protein